MKKLVLGIALVATARLFASAPADDRPFADRMEDLRNNYSDDRVNQLLAGAQSPEERAEIIKIEVMANQRGVEWWKTKRSLESIRMIATPRNVGLMALGALGVFAAWHATTLVKDVAQHYVMLPPLVEDRETSIRSWSSMIRGVFVHEEKPYFTRDQVVLSERLTAQAEILTGSIINAVENNAALRHYLFYGPPGTGKTMLAKAMALESGLEYMYFSASVLEQYSLEEGIKQIRHVFEYAKAFPKRLMIIMDEADSIFANRADASQKVRAFLNLILTYMGTEQNHFMVIALTNRPLDFDNAALNRFGEKLKIGAPALPERKRIFAYYAEKYFIKDNEKRPNNRSFLQKLMGGRPPKTRAPLHVADDVFMNNTFNKLAEQSEGMTGRDISDVMLSVQNAAFGTIDRTITRDILFAALELKKQQLVELHTEFEAQRGS